LALPDLVRAKKTQRDKDWPMVRRLVEADYYRRPARPPLARVEFWLKECRTPDMLLELGRRFPRAARRIARARPAVARALESDDVGIGQSLRSEEGAARKADRSYWQPLRAELEKWRSTRRKNYRRL
jgi:hypothetical protein